MAERDYFISFNSADEAYAKAISDALRAAGFTTFYHPDDLGYGGHIPKWMNDALAKSRQMLALCSPAYLNSDALFSESERYARYWQDTRGERFKLIPVVLKEAEFPPLLAVYKRLIVTDTTPAEAAAKVVAALKKSEQEGERKLAGEAKPAIQTRPTTYVHTSRLPETGYRRLVGRDDELRRLDQAWVNAKINIVSLIADGGAGKSALVNEWLKRLQADGYPGAELVLGWSFYSQGTQRATSAEEFLNWALEQLGITLATASASAKGDAIAEAMMERRVLLVLDGVEPLQHGPGPQVGQLIDMGLRSLLRRFAATPPSAAHGLIALTSRLAIKDIARWQDGPAPVVDVERLSDEAGAALLRDNGVLGADRELERASHEFGGHPLALGLLATFLKETQDGDVRRRDHIRGLLADVENPGHDHAARVMESYETEWLAKQPALLGIMHLVGLFDRPASGDCLGALRREPVIEGLTDAIVKLDDAAWNRAVTRLRDVRLLAPIDPSAPDALDAHPLVREWFGRRLKNIDEQAWRRAHGRIFDHLRRTTKEGNEPTLEQLGPLYEAVAHGCQAGLYQETFKHIYEARICRNVGGRPIFYASTKLCAFASNLAAISWFFAIPYSRPNESFPLAVQAWLLNEAGSCLGAQGRFGEALIAHRAALAIMEARNAQPHTIIAASNLCETELTLGNVAAAIDVGNKVNQYQRSQIAAIYRIGPRAIAGAPLAASGLKQEAEQCFASAEMEQRNLEREYPFLYSLHGHYYCDFLLSLGRYRDVVDRTRITRQWAKINRYPRDIALDDESLGRAVLGLALSKFTHDTSYRSTDSVRTGYIAVNDAVAGLRRAGECTHIVSSLLARARFSRAIGRLQDATRDLDESFEIAEPGPMKLHLCDTALERARLAFARIEAFAPLNGMLERDNPEPPKQLSDAEKAKLRAEAEKQLKIADDYIEKCGYHRRDEELAELQAVLRGERKFADLPPRV